MGGEIGESLSRKAEDMVGHSKEAGADAVASAARAAQAVADTVAEQSPAVAEYVRDAGQKIDRLAQDLREKSVGDLLNSAVQFGRAQPVVLIAGAALVGFALSRLIKAGASVSADGGAASADGETNGALGNGSFT